MNMQQREKRFPSATGTCDIRCRLWIPEEIRGAVQLTHGVSEYLDRYSDFAAFLADNGFLVYGQDIAGHGRSRGKDAPMGHFGEKDGWDALIADMRSLYLVVKADHPAIPFYLFGHSMGSFLARSYGARYPEDFDAYIFCGTSGKRVLLPFAKRVAEREITRLGKTASAEKLADRMLAFFGRRIASSVTKFDWICSDSNVVKAYAEDPLCGFPLTTCGTRDLLSGLGEVTARSWAGRMAKKPIFLLSGEEDPVGAYGKGVRKTDSALRKSGHTTEMKLYPGLRHEILNEKEHELVYGDILLFMETVAAGGELQ